MNDIDVKRLTTYNNDCNAYKQKLAQMLAERKILQENINQQCAQLSQQLGREVTLDNIEQIYEEKVNSIESILESGEAILNRIRAAENNETHDNRIGQTGQIGSVNQPSQTGQTENLRQTQQVFGGQTNFNGMPISDFRMPDQFVGMMPSQNQTAQQNRQVPPNVVPVGKPTPTEQVIRPSNAFTQQAAFTGTFNSIHVAPSNTDDVDEV